MPQPRAPRKKPAISAHTRQKLLEAAREEFLETGYFATDSNKIARRAQLAAGTFYNHFDNKLALFIEVYEQETRQEGQALLRQCLEQHGRRPELPATVEFFTAALSASRQRLRLMRMEAEILMRSEPALLAVKDQVRLEEVRLLQEAASQLGLATVAADELLMRMHIVDSLADAMASGEFVRLQAGAEAARAEIIRQMLCCVRQEAAPSFRA